MRNVFNGQLLYSENMRMLKLIIRLHSIHHLQIQSIKLANLPNLIEVSRSKEKSGLSMSHDQ